MKFDNKTHHPGDKVFIQEIIPHSYKQKSIKSSSSSIYYKLVKMKNPNIVIAKASFQNSRYLSHSRLIFTDIYSVKGKK